MAKISFKAKTETVYEMDGTPAYTRVKVPTLDRKHCDIPAFRQHPKFGGFANSDMFPNILARIKRDRLGEYIRLDRVPEGVAVDTTGFLAIVSLDA
ncbi:hypothetical protein OEG84_11535 [Hoeflea sp. G2-23]|uniref:Uncharacterized protein n=1 Tax=Hoeflea algicola TaxID=2983763 RepID=A0ABT3Z968_9HYPH|nr:hypothetical protein [Hoeflea algicola]MCY0148325.1 hypothetical protein [Hoeflea algicola]